MAAQNTIGKVSSSLTDPADTSILKKLPPLPRPDYVTQLGESSIGVLVVSIVVAAVLAIVWFTFSGEKFAPAALSVCFSIVSVESSFAIFCLLALLFGDPGVIRRKGSTCLPMPEQVAQSLQSNDAMPSRNIRGDDGSSYCVRCFVHRRKTQPKSGRLTTLVNFAPSFGIIDAEPDYQTGHHCGVCQRCVSDFDHHCGFYGRCITRKNMAYFKAIFSAGFLAGFTLVCFVPVYLWYQISEIASLISIGLLAAVCLLGGCFALCMKNLE